MSTTKRFTIVSSDVHAGGFAIKAREDGIYCLHSDYAAIEAERDDLQAFKARVMEWARGRCDFCGNISTQACQTCCHYAPGAAGTDNWTLPKKWEVGQFETALAATEVKNG